MIAPEGTFLARVRDGVVQLPPPLKQFCDAQGWSLFHFAVIDADHLSMNPVLREDSGVAFHASLGSDGRIWIPEELRRRISLGEQSVMLRMEDSVIHMYLRRVFDTLGFRPR